MIRLQNVTKYFYTNHGKKYILQNVSMLIPPHLNIGILGRNGAGKSTLMRMLGNIEFANYGRIVCDNTFSWPLALSSGFVGNLTGEANVRFVCRLYNKSKEETQAILHEVKLFSELGDYFDMPIKTYSSGMRARLNFGLSLMFDFDYLLIDETLSVGDARFKKKSKEALLKKIDTCNIVLVSHDMSTIKNLCDVGIVLDGGRLAYFNVVDDAIAYYREINERA
jgi:capsular polysaccharide transport system ATP-binding protein